MRFYGQFNVPVDEFIYERYFRARPLEGRGFFIECGAFDGLTECSCKFFEETLGWKGLNVEPSPPVYAALLKNRPQSVNVNAALSNENTAGIFHHVVHPVFGEQCTNGSLCHGETHLQFLREQNCTFRDYEVQVIRYSDLIERYHVERIDLFVLDVEGNELKVVESMRGAAVLPEVFVVEHGNLDQAEVIRAVEALGYRYDTASYVNSYFVKRGGIFDSWSERLRRRWGRAGAFLRCAEKTERFLCAGRFADGVSLRGYEAGADMFASVVMEAAGDDCVCVYSVCGLNGEECAEQVVYYRLQGDAGDTLLIRPARQAREDYAKHRGSALYLMAGNFCLIRRSLLRSRTYTVTLYLAHARGKYRSNPARLTLLTAGRNEI